MLQITIDVYLFTFFFPPTDNMSESKYGAFLSTYETPIKTRRCEHSSDPLNLNKRAVVVLTRLPEYIIGALLPVTEQVNSETESDGISDSDMLWEPQEDYRDSKSKRKTSNFKKRHTEVVPPPATSSSSTNGKVNQLLFCLAQCSI